MLYYIQVIYPCLRPTPEFPPSAAPLAPKFRVFAVIFVILSAVLVGLIVFFSMSKATIIVHPKKELLSVDFPIQVGASADAAAPQLGVKGVILEKEVSYQENIESTGTAAASASATPMVTITNKGSVGQALVATTRLMTPDGTLFRLTKGVTVPAGGSVPAEVYPDTKGTALPAGVTLTIPGLNAAKQKLIYGQSAAAGASAGTMVRTITEDDILKGKAQGLATIEENLKAQFKKDHPEVTDIAVSREIVDSSSTAKPGDAAQTVGVTVKAKVTLVGYDGAALKTLVRDKLMAALPDDKDLLSVNDTALVVRFVSADVAKGVAVLRVYADGNAAIKGSSKMLAKENVAGMSATQAKEFLENFDSIQSVDVTLFPQWLKKVPTLKDHIDIVIK